MINSLRKYLFYRKHVTLFSKFINKKKIVKNKNKNKIKSKKIFYIIKRDRWHGMFSNIHYVILHIIYAKKKNYIPIVDMKYYPTIYNEKKKLTIPLTLGITILKN